MKARILVVDDDQSVRESLKKVLQDSGYEVALAAGGLEATLRFDPEQIDLLLLDLGLPNQSGWDVFENLTTRHPFVPVIIITGLPDQYRTAVAAGVGALFEKPVEAPALLAAIEDLLAEPRETRIHRLCGRLQDTRHGPAVGRPEGVRSATTPPKAGQAHSSSETRRRRKEVLQ
jgi:two-component system, LuxR family, response regulator TtrR